MANPTTWTKLSEEISGAIEHAGRSVVSIQSRHRHASAVLGQPQGWVHQDRQSTYGRDASRGHDRQSQDLRRGDRADRNGDYRPDGYYGRNRARGNGERDDGNYGRYGNYDHGNYGWNGFGY